MAGKSSLSDDEPISEINVTPLVDVVLVLLIIFMITAPAIYQSAIKVQLPRAKSGEEAAKKSLSFSISKEGKLYLDKNELAWDQLGAMLLGLKDKNPDDSVLISADEGTPHGQVIKLMDALRGVGLHKFGLTVQNAK